MIWYFRSALPGAKYVSMIRRTGESLAEGVYHYSLTDVHPDGTLEVSMYTDSRPAPDLSGQEVLTRLQYEQALTGGPSEKPSPVLTLF
jgi:hypothetical protein